jgi:hypothetical protein
MIKKLQAKNWNIEKIHAECREASGREHYSAECGKVGKEEHTS